MSKKNVLGSDPFEWLKKDDKKENTENKKSEKGDQKKQTEKPSDPIIDSKKTGAKLEAKKEAIAYKPIDVSASPKPQEEEPFEFNDISEVNRKAVLGKDLYAHHAKTKSRKTSQKDSPATAFVIVYTVLLLILGFIIYKDLTKQIDRLETKLEVVEKKLNAGIIDYEDAEPDKW